jgi:hypothetical protein
MYLNWGSVIIPKNFPCHHFLHISLYWFSLCYFIRPLKDFFYNFAALKITNKLILKFLIQFSFRFHSNITNGQKVH